VIEKLPFKIESSDQVKHLPAIGKSLQDHVSQHSYSHFTGTVGFLYVHWIGTL